MGPTRWINGYYRDLSPKKYEGGDLILALFGMSELTSFGTYNRSLSLLSNIVATILLYSAITSST